MSKQKETIFGLVLESFDRGPAHLGEMLGFSFLAIVAGLVVIAAIDALYQMWAYAENSK